MLDTEITHAAVPSHGTRHKYQAVREGIQYEMVDCKGDVPILSMKTEKFFQWRFVMHVGENIFCPHICYAFSEPSFCATEDGMVTHARLTRRIEKVNNGKGQQTSTPYDN